MKYMAFIVGAACYSNSYAMNPISCMGNEDFGTSKNIRFVIEAVSKTTDDVAEGTKVPYKFILKNKDQVWASGEVMAEQEDVYFGFSGINASFGKIAGTIYLDELDQSFIEFNGQNLNLDCR